MIHSESDLEKIGVFPWEWVADSFDDADLFLGNGFSINLCQRLNYNSLFKRYMEGLSPESQTIFQAFGTTNFELIIQILNNAETVNKLINHPTNKIDPLKDELKSGLVRAIKDNHPEHNELYVPQLSKLANDLEEFKDIYTTNYDIFLYKIILQTISKYREEKLPDPYEDYFYEKISPTELGFNNIKVNDEARGVYYLHGALFLYPTFNRANVWKLRKLETSPIEYIALIRRQIDNDSFPVFVAEGDFQDKKAAIARNPYLTFCQNRLLQARRNLLVYGFSFGDSDRHIADVISRNKSKKIAVSIYKGSNSLDQLDKEASRLRAVFSNKEVVVIDSETVLTNLQP
ncbi:DUF4917 family protein [Pontibacter sp. 13R65]|uniref:DUF4917 family protein n=1 Tax=Pontibacter sp. 13R65 TaxID=3127458 RepID=UPI00301C8CAB